MRRVCQTAATSPEIRTPRGRPGNSGKWLTSSQPPDQPGQPYPPGPAVRRRAHAVPARLPALPRRPAGAVRRWRGSSSAACCWCWPRWCSRSRCSLTLRPLAQEDAVVPADGSTTEVSLPAGEERALYREIGSAARCEITDGSGKLVAQRPVVRRLHLQRVAGGLALRHRGRRPVAHLRRLPRRTGAGRRRCPRPRASSAGCCIGILVPLVLGVAGLRGAGRDRHPLRHRAPAPRAGARRGP